MKYWIQNIYKLLNSLLKKIVVDEAMLDDKYINEDVDVISCRCNLYVYNQHKQNILIGES